MREALEQAVTRKRHRRAGRSGYEGLSPARGSKPARHTLQSRQRRVSQSSRRTNARSRRSWRRRPRSGVPPSAERSRSRHRGRPRSHRRLESVRQSRARAGSGSAAAVIAPPAHRKAAQTVVHLRHAYRGRGKALESLPAQPAHDAYNRRRPHDLRDDVRVEHDQEAMSGASRTATGGCGSSSTPVRPNSAAARSARFDWSRSSSRTCRRICRTWSSIERPCCAARTRSRAFTDSSMLRTVMLATAGPSACTRCIQCNQCLQERANSAVRPGRCPLKCSAALRVRGGSVSNGA